jgi:hypothetical protein
MGRGALLLWLAGALTGCLVTGPIDFEVDENVPPVVLDKPGTDELSIGSILWVDKAQAATWELLVDVRDENTREPLTARWRVQSPTNMTPEFKSSQLPGVGEKLRELSVTLDQGDLDDDKCHRLERVVSGSFFPGRDDPALFDLTQRIGDLGRASWWLWEGEGDALTSPEKKAEISDTCETFELETTVTDLP